MSEKTDRCRGPIREADGAVSGQQTEKVGCREICSVYGFRVFDCPTRDARQSKIKETTMMHDLRTEIQVALNKHSAENGSNTPDFILADYLTSCLSAFDRAVIARDEWGRIPAEPRAVEEERS